MDEGRQHHPDPQRQLLGPKPHLDSVVFKFQADTAAEFQAFKSNQVQAIYPQPQIDVVDAIASGIPDAQHRRQREHRVRRGVLAEQLEAAVRVEGGPSGTSATRIDRDAVVNQLFGKLGVKAAVNSVNSFAVQDYSDQKAFAGYKLDLDKVTSLMDGRRLGEGLRRHLGEGRHQGLLHAQDDRGQQAS